ncbi:MAG: radical SAM protein [Chloroflexi bacterium]|nr:radical SAM protein [Chloroflexota bacterium]
MPVYLIDQHRASVFGTPISHIDDITLARYHAAIYDGCEFGCDYCTGWSKSMRSLTESVRMMPNIAIRAKEELAVMHRDDVIGLTADSDPYQPAEPTYRRTHHVLQMCVEAQHPVVIMTKSPLVLQDIDLIQQLHHDRFAMVIVTIISHNVDVQSRFEHKSPSTVERLALVRELKKYDIPVGVALQPLIPYVNDTDYALKRLLQMIRDAGADFVYWDYLTIVNSRHYQRINESLVWMGNYPPSYLRDLYGTDNVINRAYRQERNQMLLQLCDSFQLPIRLPFSYFAQRFPVARAVAYLLAQHASRDELMGRDVLATQGRDLAQRVLAGDWPLDLLQKHPSYPVFQPLVGQIPSV